jgi:hypothetical protein
VMVPAILAAATSFAAFLAVSIALFHLLNVQRRLQAMGVIWLTLLGLYVGLYFVFQSVLPDAFTSNAPRWSAESIVSVLNGMLIYLLTFLAFCCFYFTDHSLSINFMLEMDSRPGNQMTVTELKERFPYDKMLERRLADMVASGFLTKDGEHFCITSKGKIYAGVASAMKKFLRIDPGG